MGGWTDLYERLLLDAFTQKTALGAVTLYCGLSSTTPTEAGANFTEPTGGYVRQALTAATWTAATAGDPSSTSYGGAITFPVATGGWGTMTFAGLFTVATTATGGLAWFGTLTQAKAVQTSDTASFAAGTLLIKLGDPTDTY